MQLEHRIAEIGRVIIRRDGWAQGTDDDFLRLAPENDAAADENFVTGENVRTGGVLSSCEAEAEVKKRGATGAIRIETIIFL